MAIFQQPPQTNSKLPQKNSRYRKLHLQTVPKKRLKNPWFTLCILCRTYLRLIFQHLCGRGRKCSCRKTEFLSFATEFCNFLKWVFEFRSSFIIFHWVLKRKSFHFLEIEWTDFIFFFLILSHKKNVYNSMGNLLLEVTF